MRFPLNPIHSFNCLQIGDNFETKYKFNFEDYISFLMAPATPSAISFRIIGINLEDNLVFGSAQLMT